MSLTHENSPQDSHAQTGKEKKHGAVSKNRAVANMRQKAPKPQLGTIALVLGTIYGMAGLLLIAAGDSLQRSEKMPLIWFLALFPCVSLFILYRLATGENQEV